MFELSFFCSTGSPFMDAHASGFLEDHPSQPNRSRGPIIEELNSDDEKEESENGRKDNLRKHARSCKEPYVEDPDDEGKVRKNKQMQFGSDFNRFNNTQSQPLSHSLTFQSSTVTYGGVDGAYYTSSRTRRTRNDGLTFEECKEADSATGQAKHRVSRGIHDRGHSLIRKLNTDGRVDTLQTLHNLNDDELSGFEEAWKGSARRHLPAWNEGFCPQDRIGSNSAQNGPVSRRGRALPSTERSHSFEHIGQDTGDGSAVFPHLQHSGRMKANAGD